MTNKIESGYGLLYISQIVEPHVQSNANSSSINKLTKSFNTWGFNLSLPIVCLTDEEERYLLLTGLPIYEAAKKSDVKQIWVLLIAEKQPKAEKVIDEIDFQSSLNERLILPESLEEFREFLNDEKSPLVEISGIKEGYAKLIRSERPFNSIEDMKKKLGAKRCLNWFKAYRRRELFT